MNDGTAPRRITPAYPQWQAVLRLILDTFAFMEKRIDPPSSAHRLTVVDMAAQAETDAVWVIEDSATPIACLFAKPKRDALYLGKIAIAQSHRGRGLLRRLINCAEAEARARSLRRLELETRIELTENHATFARFGFVRAGETAHPGYDRPTSITMSRPVAARPPHLRYAGCDPITQRAAFEEILRADPLIWRALAQSRDLALPDWRIVAGALYNTVWNSLTGRPSGHGIKDIDLFYFDASDLSYEAEDRVIQRAASHFAPDGPPVEVRNQARVHLWYEAHFGHPIAPLTSSDDSIARFSSLTHCVGARLGPDNRLDIHAPYGLDPIFAFRLISNPLNASSGTYAEKAERNRVHWPEITIEPWPTEETP
jgi:GNAT superfamily N-acetyltransferase